jgi:predicted site-specific integrase-resolvase
MKLYSTYQLASKLGVTHTTVYSWIEKGLPHEYVAEGRRMSIRIDIDEAKNWIKENQRKLVK